MSDQPVRIALDGMGGDRGAETVIAGAARALKWTQDLRFIIFGDEAVLGPLLRRHQTLASVAEVQHAPDVVTGDAKPSQALRARLKNMRLPGTFVGFVEGDDIPAGKVDLVVTDGFTGNVALKTAEGTSRLIADFIRQSARGSFWSRLGFALAMPAFRELKRRMDPRKYNGAMLLGVRGICIKSHGGADAEAFATAIGLASTLAQSDINQRIEHEIADLLSMPQASVG